MHKNVPLLWDKKHEMKKGTAPRKFSSKIKCPAIASEISLTCLWISQINSINA